MEKKSRAGAWNSYYGSIQDGEIDHDDWLPAYERILPDPGAALDLGCGEGYAGKYLLDRGFRVVFCDLSSEALRLVKKRIPGSDTLELDVREKLPFESRSAAVVVADLSLHYFDWKTTEKIADDITRVLVHGGLFLCRVNAFDDILHGAGKGSQMEPGYYLHDGNRKRFFTRDDLVSLFSPRLEILGLEHRSIIRKGNEKRLWEAALRANRGNS